MTPFPGHDLPEASATPNSHPDAVAPGKLARLRDDAAEFVAGTLYLRHPELYGQAGDSGRESWREHIRNHVDSLEAALACQDSRLCVDYAAWLAEVLSSRGMPGALLAESFSLLAHFLARHLEATESAAAAAILTAAAAATLTAAPPAGAGEPRQPSAPALADSYRLFALAGDHAAAQEVVQRGIQDGLAYAELGVRLIQPAMHEIGRLWQQNRVSVAQEHLATAVTQNALVRAYMQAEFAPANGRKALFACVPGNQHSLGLRILADSFEIAGWEIAYLGADVPAADLVHHAGHWRPDLLALSISLPWQIPVARATIARLRTELADSPFILVGGLTTNVSEQLWRSLGADGWASDGIAALRLAGS
ncbi:MAG: hypothetical protein HGA75_09000 [Thiobacillus sp.]|nr:hypothetical protein [Thiobacillus sp.]